MSEWQLYAKGTVPEWTTPGWYAGIERAPHLDQDLHRGRLHLAANLARTIPNAALSTLVDLGAGDGGFLSLIEHDFLDCWGYDLQPSNVAGADQRGVDVRLRDVLEDEILWGNVAVCTEMLEHLLAPHAFAARIRRHCKWLVCSSPYTETFSEHYGHHAWAWDQHGYASMLEAAGWTVVRQETVDIFQVVLAK